MSQLCMSACVYPGATNITTVYNVCVFIQVPQMSQLFIMYVYLLRCHECPNCISVFIQVLQMSKLFIVYVCIQQPQMSQLFIVFGYLFRCHKCHNCLLYMYIYSGATNVTTV